MAAFEYVALDDGGRRRKGVVEGDSGRQVRQTLRDQGLTPLEVNTTTKAANDSTQSSVLASLSWHRRGMSALGIAMFTRQLSTLITAGLPVEEALGAVAQQTERRHVSSMIMTVRSKVLEGHSLAVALGEFPSTFDMMFRSTVASGEQSGYLGVVLANLATYTEQRFESRRNVEMAMFYPVLLFFAAVLIVSGLMVYVVPEIVKVFDTTDSDLPLITVMLIGTSEFFQSYFILLAIAVAGAAFAMRWLLARPDLRLRWDRYKLTLPLVGRIARGGNAARYASTLAILNSSGVPLVDAMTIAGEVVNNQWMKRRLGDSVQRVSEGSSLRAALETTGHFPPMFLYMIASGESSGELDTMLAKVADYQQQELERLVSTIVRLFEPIMLLVMAGMVLVIVLAILLPILSMNQLIV